LDNSGNQLYTISQPYSPGVPYGLPVRVKYHYWYDNQTQEGKAQLDIYEIDSVDADAGDWIMGSSGGQTVIDAGGTLLFDIFGLGNRMDGPTLSDNVSKIDNIYFSTVHENVNPAFPSFGSFTLKGDVEPDGDVDWYDLSNLIAQWLNNCSAPDWCDNCDINHDGIVDLADFGYLAENWLEIK
jgi:hypothetical protein